MCITLVLLVSLMLSAPIHTPTDTCIDIVKMTRLDVYSTTMDDTSYHVYGYIVRGTRTCVGIYSSLDEMTSELGRDIDSMLINMWCMRANVCFRDTILDTYDSGGDIYVNGISYTPSNILLGLIGGYKEGKNVRE